MAAVKVTGGLAVDAARVAAGGMVVKTAEEASVDCAGSYMGSCGGSWRDLC